MHDNETRRAIETKKLFVHDLSFFKFFNLLFILLPIVGWRVRFNFESGTIVYQDIYLFGFRIIRWQL